MNNMPATNKKHMTGGSLSVAPSSAPLYDVFFGNNDYDTTGSTPAEALSEISFELETAMVAVLLLRHGITKADALKAVDDLRWLVESSDLPNASGEPMPAASQSTSQKP